MKMKKSVIYTTFTYEYRHVIEYLNKEHGWNPAFVFGSEHLGQWVKENYKDAIFHAQSELISYGFDFNRIGMVKVPIDAEIIEALSKHEAYYLLSTMSTSDSTGWNFSAQERARYYYDLLIFWNTILKNVKPDIFVTYTMPHTLTDYVLYRLCKYYQIPVLYIDHVPLFNYQEDKYFYIGVSLEKQSDVFKGLYHSDKTYPLPNGVKEYLKSIRSKEGLPPPYCVHFIKNIGKHWNPGFLRVCRRLIKLLVTGRLFEKPDLMSWKDNKQPFDSEKSKMNNWQTILFQERICHQDKKLRKIYSSFVKEADLNKKYIYYAAAVQPEAGIWSTYQDQLLLLEVLSSSIPDDWLIYYKEHPGTFIVGGKASLVRDRHYYDRISSYKNIVMIPSETDTFKLINSAQAVATPSGTVGWESIVRGTPVLIFGHVWYQGCKSVFEIHSRRDCIDAIQKINNGFKPDQADIEKFVGAVLQLCEKNIICGYFYQEELQSCLDPQEEMVRIAKHFYKAYETHYSDRSQNEKVNLKNYNHV